MPPTPSRLSRDFKGRVWSVITPPRLSSRFWLQPQALRPSRHGQRQPLRDQAVGRAGGLAGAVGVEDLRLDAVELVEVPRPDLAQELPLLLPEHAGGLGRLLRTRAGLDQRQRAAELAEVHAD